MTSSLAADKAMRRRVDAARNRERILAATRDAFTDPNADVSMAEIARRAGIGSATLYRNFADRRALLEAVYSDEIGDICQAAASSAGDDAGAELTSWLRRFYDYFTNKRALASELLQDVDADSPFFTSGLTRIVNAANPLVDAAHRSGELRAELSLMQILALVTAVANIPGDPDYRKPVLDAVLDGLQSHR